MDLNGDINPAAGAGLPAPAASSKRCRKCGDEKPLSEFYTYKHRPRYACMSCMRALDRARAKVRRESMNADERRAFVEKHNEGHERFRKARRARVLAGYGGECACCGERTPGFLAVDHVFGGGQKHKKSIKGHWYGWLIRNNFPPGFRLLCHNCNQARQHYGQCPHEVAAYDLPFARRMESEVNNVGGGYGVHSDVIVRAT